MDNFDITKWNRDKYLNEIKINNPLIINPVSFDTFKKALIQDIDWRFHDLLDGEETEEFIQKAINEFTQAINKVNLDKDNLFKTVNQLERIYEEIGGFSRDQFTVVMLKIFIK